MKSVEGGTKGKNEVRFYEELIKNESLINLRELVPSYFGTVTVDINSIGWYIGIFYFNIWYIFMKRFYIYFLCFTINIQKHTLSTCVPTDSRITILKC